MWNIRLTYSVEIYKRMVVMHYPNFVPLKTCSGMAKRVIEEYFGRRGPERQPIWNDAVWGFALALFEMRN
jgi:hypothetical protein